MLWRFLNKFKQLVGAFYVHALWQPYYAHLVASLARLQRQFSQQGLALAGGDDGLLVFASHGRHPFVHGEVGACSRQQFVPFACKVVARGLMVGTHRRQFDGGVGEVQVGVLQLAQHGMLCGGRRRLVVVGCLVACQQVAGEADGQRLLAHALRSAEHDGVWQTSLAGHLYQSVAHLFLAYYFAECHLCLFSICDFLFAIYAFLLSIASPRFRQSRRRVISTTESTAEMV